MWVHLSPNPLERNELKVIEQSEESRGTNKPNGIWIGWARISNGNIESEWLDFIGDGWYKNKSKYFYEVEYDNRILEVNSGDYIYKLRKYKNKPDQFSHILGSTINWKMFAQDYNGIVFTDYYKTYNFEFYRSDVVYMFHDLLDMKSGCIWNPDSITKWEEIKPRPQRI